MTALLMPFSFSLSTSNVSAESVNKEKMDSEVEKLANVLEFVFEEAVIEDKHGNIVDIDTAKIEEKFGDSPELESLKEAIKKEKNSIQPMINPDGPDGQGAKMRKCTDAKIKNEWGQYITDATGAGVVGAIMNKNYKKGAKLLIKNGVKGSYAGIVYTLGKHWVQCFATV